MAAIDLGAEDKKKLYILGGLVAVFVLGLLVFKPFGGRRTSSSSTTSTTTTTSASTSGVTPLSSRGGSLTSASSPAASGSTTMTTTTGGGSALYIPFSGARSDPFVPHYVAALPPSRRPAPPLPPLRIPSPGEYSEGTNFPSTGAFPGLPPARIAAGAGDSGILSNLPQVRIPQLTPRTTSRMTSSNPFSSESGGSESSSARLAGVVIGDSVRALVEVTTPSGQVVSRVVQPGDEIEGIRILRLERVEEGGQSVTRMTVSQNGREQYFTLRPSSTPRGTGAAGGGFGLPGTFTGPRNNGFVTDDE